MHYYTRHIHIYGTADVMVIADNVHSVPRGVETRRNTCMHITKNCNTKKKKKKNDGWWGLMNK